MPGFNIPLDNYNASSCGEPQKRNVTTIGGGRVLPKADNTIETARAHRWIVELSATTDYGDLSEITLYAKTCQRPSFEVDIITIHHQAEEIYRPGKYRWNPIDIVFYEYLKGTDRYSNKTSRELYKWWTTAISTDHKQKPVTDINSVTATIAELDGEGRISRKYSLYNCKLIKVSPSDLDYTSSEISTNTVTIKYDYAIEEEE